MSSSSLPLIRNGFSNLSTVVASWNSYIREAVNQGCAHRALLLFRHMKLRRLEPNNFTFPFVAKACAKLSNLNYSQIIHTHVVKSQFQTNIFVQAAMIDMYVKCSELEYARILFDKMSVRDLASWNTMLSGFAQSGLLERSLSLLREMRITGIQPDAVTIMGMTEATLHTKKLRFVKAIHAIGIHTGVHSDVSVANTWISAYSKCNDLELAEKVFNEIEMDARTVVSWNSLIAGYSNFDCYFKAMTSYKQMLIDGFRPDLSTVISLLSSCTEPEALLHGALIHSHGIQLGCHCGISFINTLISMYSKCGDITSARNLFDTMADKTSVSWTAIISCYAERGDIEEAMPLFHSMEESGEKPDLVTLLTLISGCGKIGALELGKWVHNYASLNGFKENVVLRNALIDMYAKCGSMKDAREIFNGLIYDRTVVSWTAVISGCALNGEFREALDLFFKMLEFGFKPNEITFLSVLQACGHGGLLEKGRQCFGMMNERYGISPGLDHYSCMIDLLGRRGELHEALGLIRNMPFKPDAGIWGALLGACKIHRNIEIGEYVANKLIELEPEMAASFVGMANLYASVGRWDRVATIRTMMRSNRVRKLPGQSIIQVNGKPYIFTVEDRGHPEALLIYRVLDCLTLQSKEKEYSTNVIGAIEHELE